MPDTNIKPWTEVAPGGRMLRPAEVVRVTGLSRSQIYQMISDGEFPPFIKLSQRASALPETWLQAFIEACAEAIGSERGCSSVATASVVVARAAPRHGPS
ncbi:MAG: AlpA family phage regulatory protein [Vannielia sp.]|uniref:helix-turn-helix transcriptional regulator n=1 Tax=Vannielia sp. TaxID=2813045 RepID=UPI003B8B1088